MAVSTAQQCSAAIFNVALTGQNVVFADPPNPLNEAAVVQYTLTSFQGTLEHPFFRRLQPHPFATRIPRRRQSRRRRGRTTSYPCCNRRQRTPSLCLWRRAHRTRCSSTSRCRGVKQSQWRRPEYVGFFPGLEDADSGFVAPDRTEHDVLLHWYVLRVYGVVQRWLPF